MSLPSDMDGDNDFGAEDGSDAFLKSFLPADADAEKPSRKGKEEDEDDSEETPDTASEDQSDESPDDADDEGEGEEDPKKRKFAEDDDATYVKVKVGDEEHEVSVKDLKRLWGQETALNSKSQQVAEQRKAVEAEQSRYITSTATLLDRAKARFEPYAKIDFLLAAKELSAEDYTALRQEAEAAYADVKFLSAEVDSYVKQAQEKTQAQLVATAKETIKVLSGDPKDGGIEGWSEKLYDDIRSYAVTQGIEPDVVNKLVDASAIRILHKAMLYERGKSKVVTTKVNKTPKKVVKTSSNPDATRKATKGSDKVIERHKREQSTDSAADAFMSRWAKDND
jgi:hypothetical protein